MRITKRFILLAAALLLSAPFFLAARHPAMAQSPLLKPNYLKVALYPYIPDAKNDNYQTLRTMLIDGFKKSANKPDLTVDIDINPAVDLYDMATLRKLLGAGSGAAHVVELDTILLGDLAKAGLVLALDKNKFASSSILPEIWKAVTVENTIYGVPTYLCTNVIYAYSEDLKKVVGGAELLKVLQNISPEKAPLVGNYAGSWTLSSAYLDAWADTNNKRPDPTSEEVQAETIQYLKPLVQSCKLQAGTNPCLDGTYKEHSRGAEYDFASNLANGFFGYTERLFFILKIDPKRRPYVISAPMGKGSTPVMFVDALVINPNCTGQCREDAIEFIKFMTNVETRNLIAFSKDAPGAPPRYLLQANQAFYSSKPANDDPFYPVFKSIVERALAFPNEGLLTSRKALQQKVQDALK